MQDPDHFRKLQKAYYKSYCRGFDIQSSQILFSAFHPSFQSSEQESDHVLMLEQIFTPTDQEYIVLDEKKKLMKERLLYYNKGFNPERPGRESFRVMQSSKGIDVEEIGSPLLKGEPKKKRRYSINFTEETILTGTQQSAENMLFTSTHQLQKPIKIQFEHHNRGEELPFGNNVLYDDLIAEKEVTDYSKKKTNHVMFNKKSVRFKKRGDSVVSHRDDYFGDTQMLEQTGKYKNNANTDVQFKLTIWKFIPFSNEQASIMAEQSITVSHQKVFVFKNQLFFSNDAEYVYMFLHNETGWMMKGLIFNSDDLTKPAENIFDMEDLKINGKFASLLVWYNPDSSNSNNR